MGCPDGHGKVIALSGTETDWLKTNQRKEKREAIRAKTLAIIAKMPVAVHTETGWTYEGKFIQRIGNVTRRGKPPIASLGEIHLRISQKSWAKFTFQYLHERQKTYCEAGSPGGKGWTPFKDTCEKLLVVVKRTPGIRVSEAIRAIDHHYCSLASAKQSLSLWASRGKIPGIEARIVNGKLCLFPKE